MSPFLARPILLLNYARMSDRTSQKLYKVSTSKKVLLQYRRYIDGFLVITKDLIRNVVVPSKDKAPSAICISQNTIKSVREKSVVRTREEIQLEVENARQEQQDSLNAAAQRKMKFQEADLVKQVSRFLVRLLVIFTQTRN